MYHDPQHYEPIVGSEFENQLSRHGQVPGDSVVFTGEDYARSYKMVGQLPDVTKSPEKVVIPTFDVGTIPTGMPLMVTQTGKSKVWAQFNNNTKEVGSVTNVTCQRVDNHVEIRWNDPVDTSDITWQKTVLVRKAGGYPVSVNDGIVLVESYVRDRYATTPWAEELPSEINAEWYYRLFSYSFDGVISSSGDAKIRPLEFDWSKFHSYIQQNLARKILKIGDVVEVYDDTNPSNHIDLVVLGFDIAVPTDERTYPHTITFATYTSRGSFRFDKPRSQYTLVEYHVVKYANDNTYYTYNPSTGKYAIVPSNDPRVQMGKVITADMGLYVFNTDTYSITYGKNDWYESELRLNRANALKVQLTNYDPAFASLIRDTRISYLMSDGTIGNIVDDITVPSEIEWLAYGGLTAATDKVWLRDAQTVDNHNRAVVMNQLGTKEYVNPTASKPTVFMLTIG